MIVCPACGERIDATVRACPNCGMPNAQRRQNGGWFSFQGRITAREYWLLYMLPISLADVFSGLADVAAHAGGVIEGISAVVTLAGSLAGATKRLHDRDRSGWLQLIVLIPVLGWIWIFLELSLRGTRGPNRYGPDPLAGSGR